MTSRLLNRLLKIIKPRQPKNKRVRTDNALAAKGDISVSANTSEQADEDPKILTDNLKVHVDYLPMDTTAFFDVSVKEGITVLKMNSTHVFSKRLLNEASVERREAMEVCLAAWAKMERECTNQKRLTQIQLTRRDWGQLLDDHLE